MLPSTYSDARGLGLQYTRKVKLSFARNHYLLWRFIRTCLNIKPYVLMPRFCTFLFLIPLYYVSYRCKCHEYVLIG